MIRRWTTGPSLLLREEVQNSYVRPGKTWMYDVCVWREVMSCMQCLLSLCLCVNLSLCPFFLLCLYLSLFLCHYVHLSPCLSNSLFLYPSSPLSLSSLVPLSLSLCPSLCYCACLFLSLSSPGPLAFHSFVLTLKFMVGWVMTFQIWHLRNNHMVKFRTKKHNVDATY